MDVTRWRGVSTAHRLRDGRPPGCDHLPQDIFVDSFFADMESVARCIHCDRIFKLGDAIWDPDWSFWCCPYPGCSGTLIDFIPARRTRRLRKRTPAKDIH